MANSNLLSLPTAVLETRHRLAVRARERAEDNFLADEAAFKAYSDACLLVRAYEDELGKRSKITLLYAV